MDLVSSAHAVGWQWVGRKEPVHGKEAMLIVENNLCTGMGCHAGEMEGLEYSNF